MTEVEKLVSAYRERVQIPWQAQLSVPERVWMLVYPPELERRVRRQFGEFKRETEAAGHKWRELDLLPEFAAWMSKHEYRDGYFADPNLLEQDAFDPLRQSVIDRVQALLESADGDTVTAILGAASLFGFVHLSSVLDNRKLKMRGRLLVCFPGSHGEHSYRLLDARSNYNYQASPITASGGTR